MPKSEIDYALGHDMLVSCSKVVGEAFFPVMTEALANALSVRWVLLCRLVPEDCSKARTIAYWDNGPAANFEYSLNDTPCANILDRGTCVYPRSITQLFPEDETLVEMGAESYVGAPLRSTSGEVLGLLAILDEKPIERVETASEVVEVFAARAGAELERLSTSSDLERFGKIVEDSVSEVYVFDATTFMFKLVNRGARENIGYSAEELQTLTPWDIKPEIGRDEFIAMVEPLVQGVEPSLSFETVHRRKDGTLYDVAVQLQYIGGAESVFYASITDITERKRADNNLRLLVDELNHRVKNTLAIVQSVAHQSFKTDTPRPAQMKAFRERLAALAAAHNLLTQGGWDDTTLADVASQTIGATCAELDRVSFSGPPVRLGPKTAVTLAMALHELCTNAVKYGALSNKNGRVEMSWSFSRQDRALQIVWQEIGGPPVEGRPSRKGFGTRMIELALAQELGGDVSMDFRPDGLVCTINGSVNVQELA